MTSNSSSIDLSIIVPVYNEEDGINQALIEIYNDASSILIKTIINTIEVIVVDDGSFDNTYQILKKVKKNYKNLRIIRHKSNQGLGASITTGVNNATKEYVTYLPADGQARLREIYNGLKIASKADLVLTYRGIRGDYNPYRHILSNTLMICMKAFFNLNFKDYNWVHIYRRNLFNTIKVKSKGVFYLGEIIARSNRAGMKILEAEAKYHPRLTGISKNARLSVAIRTLRDLISLWIELKFSHKVP